MIDQISSKGYISGGFGLYCFKKGKQIPGCWKQDFKALSKTIFRACFQSGTRISARI